MVGRSGIGAPVGMLHRPIKPLRNASTKLTDSYSCYMLIHATALYPPHQWISSHNIILTYVLS